MKKVLFLLHILCMTFQLSIAQSGHSEEPRAKKSRSSFDIFPSIASIEDIKPEDLILKWSTSKQTIHLGDTLHCYFDLYTKLDILEVNNTGAQVFDDCYFTEDSVYNSSPLKIIEYNGDDYRYLRIASYTVTPLRAGHYRIGGNTFHTTVTTKDPNVSPFDMFMSSKGIQHENYEKPAEYAEFDVVTDDNYQTELIDQSDYGQKTYLLCDVSGSMKFMDIEPDRCSAVKEFATKWLKDNSECGLITFAGSIESIQPSHAVIDTISFPQMPKKETTALGDALLMASALGENVRDVIVVTDGDGNTEHFTLNTALKILIERNVRISYIYLNSDQDSVYHHTDDRLMHNPRLTKVRTKDISDMVKLSGGIFANAKTKDELMALIPRLKSVMAKRRKSHKHLSDLNKQQVDYALQTIGNKYRK